MWIRNFKKGLIKKWVFPEGESRDEQPKRNRKILNIHQSLEMWKTKKVTPSTCIIKDFHSKVCPLNSQASESLWECEINKVRIIYANCTYRSPEKMHPTVMRDPLDELWVTCQSESMAESSVSSVKFRQISITKKLRY